MPKASAPRGLIITADDFGLQVSVNEAVERACRDGVLTAASLMVSAPATTDAVARAHGLPKLRVGLHLVLADGFACLPATDIPELVDAQGRFGSVMLRDGIRFFFLPRVRRQLAAEIRAQFEAFAVTGLNLDHVNAHKHFHLHPTVLGLILSIGQDFGLKAVRLPWESDAPWWLRPWLSLTRSRLRRANISFNDHVFGIAHSGAMDEAALLASLDQLPAGVSEIYLHPATCSGSAIAASMHGYRHADELAALLSIKVRERIDAIGIRCGGFVDLFPTHS